MRADTERLIYGTQPLTEAELKNWQKEAPYFVLPAFCALKRNTYLSEEQRARLLARVAIQVSDREALYDLIGDDQSRFANFYPDRREQPTTTTEATIDSFLETFGHGSQRETDALTKMIFNPVPSYEAALMAEVNGTRKSQPAALANENEIEDDLPAEIDEPAVPEAPVKSKPSRQYAQTGNLSESFAKIMIKNGNYEKALEIITGISLNNPEKSIYFADQIRFLQKLILNKQKTKN